MRRTADAEVCATFLEAEWLGSPSEFANSVSGCASTSTRTTPSCARLPSCTVALREAEKPGGMGKRNLGFAGVKNDSSASDGLSGLAVVMDCHPGLRFAWPGLSSCGPLVLKPIRQVAVVGTIRQVAVVGPVRQVVAVVGSVRHIVILMPIQQVAVVGLERIPFGSAGFRSPSFQGRNGKMRSLMRQRHVSPGLEVRATAIPKVMRSRAASWLRSGIELMRSGPSQSLRPGHPTPRFRRDKALVRQVVVLTPVRQVADAFFGGHLNSTQIVRIWSHHRSNTRHSSVVILTEPIARAGRSWGTTPEVPLTTGLAADPPSADGRQPGTKLPRDIHVPGDFPEPLRRRSKVDARPRKSKRGDTFHAIF